MTRSMSIDVGCSKREELISTGKAEGGVYAIFVRACNFHPGVCYGIRDGWRQGENLIHQENPQENLLMVMVEEGRCAKIYDR